ncbi:hypothetical protein AMS68_006545 [Peltaster fructicola]|uniref:HTH APSES-type domain-containing protein n=1 Tax=Peltaster fructicola TaxID=286661 RepID=A0A6H0Y2F1_9PEZI|nr:hypothetical protein AMS68_006545 [Peltaster fructicola]
MTSHSFSQMPSQASPQQLAASQAMGNMGLYSSAGYSMSFDNGQYPPPATHGHPVNFTQSFPTTTTAAARISRSQIYTAVYSGVQVYEMDVGGVACMRRRHDGWLNATQILKIAGVDKGRRTKVLEKEILTGEHEKVQGGYGKYQGTWIPFAIGVRFCRAYGVEEILKPLLEYDIVGGGPEGQDTPTKEQAMAASRKKMFMNAGNNGPLAGNGTFFQNISSSTSVALAGLSKAARLNSPGPRASRPAVPRQASQQEVFSASQQSMTSQNSFTGDDSAYNGQPNGEPPRKRIRRESTDMAPPSLPVEVPMSPTEPNESFMYEPASQELQLNGEPMASTALPNPSTREDQEKMNLILDLFAEQGKIEYSQHPALKQLSGEDFNIPLDASANNALHWAATLAKVPLLKLLIQKGANIWRGNAAGQTPLVAAVIVNNCWEHQCFPELLELLSPLIEVRDVQGRTVLHHIAVSSGIKGRAPSSKYYLEALLEFLVRIGTKKAANGMDMSLSEDLRPQKSGAVSLVRFLSHIVNARDKAGNTALNLVARIGNRSIIQQLLEIHADPALPNNKGVSAKDFGVGVQPGEPTPLASGLASQQPSQEQTDGCIDPALGVSQTEELGQDVIASMTALLTQNLASHKEILRQRTEEVDKLNAQIQEFSAVQKAELEKFQDLQIRVKRRDERQARLRNLRRAVDERKKSSSSATPLGTAESNLISKDVQAALEMLTSGADAAVSPSMLKVLSASLTKNNASLKRKADELHSRSSELEKLYRRVVSLCTGVPEDKVEEALPNLIAAIESEKSKNLKGGEAGDVTRVRDFLKRVEKGGAGVEV